MATGSYFLSALVTPKELFWGYLQFLTSLDKIDAALTYLGGPFLVLTEQSQVLEKYNALSPGAV